MSSWSDVEIADMAPLTNLGVHYIKIKTYQYSIDPDIQFTTVKDLLSGQIIYYFTFHGGPYMGIKEDDVLSLVVEMRLLGYLKYMKTDKLEAELKKYVI